MKQILPESYMERWHLQGIEREKLQEIRLRCGQPLFLIYEGNELEKTDVIVAKADIDQIFQWLCGYGVYAYQEKIAKGYITVQGGHRVGIGGQVLFDSVGNVVHMKYISSILIRVSHDIKGVAECVLDKLYENGYLQSTLILSPPGCGKTTLLRDLVRQVSNGNMYSKGKNVSLVDEREELAAVYEGVPTVDVGRRTDVISGCEKALAMEMCLRALGPEVVAVDEIYSENDLQAVKRLHGCGCVILATHHAYSFDEFREKTFGKELMEQGMFMRFVVLGKENGRYVINGVYDARKMDWRMGRESECEMACGSLAIGSRSRSVL